MSFSGLEKKFRDEILLKARGKLVALPEADDSRVIEASQALEKDFGVRVHLVTRQEAEREKIRTLNAILACATESNKKPKAELMASDPFYFAGALLREGKVDAMVGGACTDTAHVIKAALATVGLEENSKIITSGFLMSLPKPTAGGQSILIYSDGAIIPQPSTSQLVDIGYLAANAFQKWTGIEPKVGFLSFSTAGSADHADVQKVREAAQIFAKKFPLIKSEGEIQFDAAIDPEIAIRKNKNSVLKGQTNVFVFPDLDAGNIGYKMTQRLGGAEAWGPILFGTRKPVSDLSRGASALDIVHTCLLVLALS